MAVTDSPRGLPVPHDGQDIAVDGGGPAAASSLRLGSAQPVHGALADQAAGLVSGTG
jgi:hypothetical protein